MLHWWNLHCKNFPLRLLSHHGRRKPWSWRYERKSFCCPVGRERARPRGSLLCCTWCSRWAPFRHIAFTSVPPRVVPRNGCKNLFLPFPPLWGVRGAASKHFIACWVTRRVPDSLPGTPGIRFPPIWYCSMKHPWPMHSPWQPWYGHYPRTPRSFSWATRINFLPAQTIQSVDSPKGSDGGTVKVDVRYLGWGSPVGGNWYPGSIEIWRGDRAAGCPRGWQGGAGRPRRRQGPRPRGRARPRHSVRAARRHARRPVAEGGRRHGRHRGRCVPGSGRQDRGRRTSRKPRPPAATNTARPPRNSPGSAACPPS